MSGDNIRLLAEVNQRSKDSEREISDINSNLKDIYAILDKKVDKEICIEYRKNQSEKIDDAKKIALSKVSKTTCDTKSGNLETKITDLKTDWRYWITTGMAIVALLIAIYNKFGGH